MSPRGVAALLPEKLPLHAWCVAVCCFQVVLLGWFVAFLVLVVEKCLLDVLDACCIDALDRAS